MLSRDAEINGKVISIQQDLSLSHAGTVWDGALTLGYYLDKNPEVAKQFITNKKVLELGSGTGFTGIASLCFDPQIIFLTDLPQYLDILSKNAEINKKTSEKGVAKVVKLSWGDKVDIQSVGPIDTIIASQIAYDIQSIRLFMQTLLIFRQKNEAVKIMISYQKYPNKEKNIHEIFCKYFGPEGFKEVGWNEMNHDYRDENIGIVYIR